MFMYSIFIEILYVIANAVINAVRFVFAKVKEAASKIPKSVIDEVARALLPNILDYFASDRGKKEFEEWKKKNIVKKSNIFRKNHMICTFQDDRMFLEYYFKNSHI